MDPPPSQSLDRYCLVTVGATVGFKRLTQEVLRPAFWSFLASKGFTILHVQCGPDIAWAKDQLLSSLGDDEVSKGLAVDVFDSRKNLLKEEMTLCKAAKGLRSQGLVISHAGK